MRHIFFFSYSSKNESKELRAFFEQLCEEVALYTSWDKDDSRISFRDGKDLPLMAEWKPGILEALQTSAVLVCVTSVAYFETRFCGQEYYLFDQRRRQSLAPGAAVPPVILPVLWAPAAHKRAIFSDEIQMKSEAAGMLSKVYWEKGLRYLKRFDPNEYEKVVVAFAEAIFEAHQRHPAIPALREVKPFDQIPDAFADGVWKEAADAQGWIDGPGVANFVFAAARGDELKQPLGRYGGKPAEWRPYLPPEPRTIADLAQAAARKNSLLYREIVVDERLAEELRRAHQRKNLTLVVADPQTLPIEEYQAVAAFDAHTCVGAALLMLWDGAAGPWEERETLIAQTFPIRAQLKAPWYLAPVRSVDELETVLDTTLVDLRGELTRAEIEKKERVDEPPAQVSGPAGAGG